MSRVSTRKLGFWLTTAALIAVHLFFRTQAHADVPLRGAWKEVYSRTGDCKISFPALPQMFQQSFKVDESGKKLTYDIYLAPYQDRGVCMLLIAQYPMPLPKGHEVVGLEGLLKGIVGQHPDNQLIFAELIDINGFPALTFLVQSGKNYFRGQAFMIGNKLFMVAMEGGKQNFEEPTFQRFLKSFELMIP
jgi:hypothetical protein